MGSSIPDLPDVNVAAPAPKVTPARRFPPVRGMSALPLSSFLTDPSLLGRDFAGPSWDAWKVVLAAAFGEPLTAAEAARFRELADRDPPRRRVEELWLAVGRRAGKDSIASAIATYLAVYGDFARFLRRGEAARIACLAVDRDQARIVFNYIKAYFEEIPLLRPLLVSAKDDIVRLNNGVEIIVATNSFRGIRGGTIACAIFDEVAFWRDTDFANPDAEVYRALKPAMISLRDGSAMLIGISTVHKRSGLLYDKVTAHFGKDDDRVLAILAPSTTFNPLLSDPAAQAEIAQSLVEDPERAAAEWNSVWHSDLSDLFDRQLVDAAIDRDVRIRFPRGGVTYIMTADASGGRSDSFTAAIGHVEGDLYVIDRIYERRAPFDVEVAMDEVAQLAHDYRVATVHHDDYGADLVVAGFRRRGLTSKPVAIRTQKLNRSEIYLDSVSAFSAGRVRLPHNERLVHQLISLERRPVAGGHDRVDHPKGGGNHDDIANATCAAIVLLGATRTLRISPLVLANSRLPAGTRTLADLPPDATSREKVSYMTGAEATFAPAAQTGRSHVLYITDETLRRAAERPAERPASIDLAAHYHH